MPVVTLNNTQKKQFAQDFGPALRDILRSMGQTKTDLGKAITELAHASNVIEVDVPSTAAATSKEVSAFGIRIRIRIRLRGDAVPSLGLAKGSEFVIGNP